MPRKLSALALCCFLCLPPQALAWGNEGHRLINRVAAQRAPADMPGFFRNAVARLEYLGPEPDRWHNPAEFALKNSQEPDHFVNLEMLAGLGDLPPGRYQFIHKLEEARTKNAAGSAPAGGQELTPDRVGMQPYIAMEIYDRLKVAFREYRRLQKEHQSTEPAEQNAVYYAGWLGHYVADAAQPLHTTIHYNGWVGPNPEQYTTSKQTHWNFEGPFVADHLAQLTIANDLHAPRKLAHPFQDYMQYIRESYAQVEPFYKLEKAGAFKDAGTSEGIAFTRARLAVGAQMLLDMWYTAWLESAVEPPDPFAPKPVTNPVAPKPS